MPESHQYLPADIGHEILRDDACLVHDQICEVALHQLHDDPQTGVEVVALEVGDHVGILTEHCHGDLVEDLVPLLLALEGDALQGKVLAGAALARQKHTAGAALADLALQFVVVLGVGQQDL